GLPGGLPGAARPPGLPGAAGATGQTQATKTITLRLIAPRKGPDITIESGLLDDIRITPDLRTNSIVISAPTQTMELLLVLIAQLDVPPAARAEVNVFRLKNADATATAGTIQQLFLGTAAGFTAAAVPLPGGGGAP